MYAIYKNTIQVIKITENYVKQGINRANSPIHNDFPLAVSSPNDIYQLINHNNQLPAV